LRRIKDPVARRSNARLEPGMRDRLPSRPPSAGDFWSHDPARAPRTRPAHPRDRRQGGPQPAARSRRKRCSGTAAGASGTDRSIEFRRQQQRRMHRRAVFRLRNLLYSLRAP